MPDFEYLHRVDLHSKQTDCAIFLLVWGTDAMDAMRKVSGICGPDGEYSCDSITIQMRDGEPRKRERGMTYRRG